MRRSEYALHFLGVPYLFGGNTPNPGWDCSGLACEVLRADGWLGKEDLSAQQLFDYLCSRNWKLCEGVECPDSGLAFFGDDVENVEHVAITQADRSMIEAGGGNAKCATVEEAAKQGAYTRIRPLKWRKDFLAILVPPKP